MISKTELQANIAYVRRCEAAAATADADNDGQSADDFQPSDDLWLACVAVFIEDAGCPGTQFVQNNKAQLRKARTQGYDAEMAEYAVLTYPGARSA